MTNETRYMGQGGGTTLKAGPIKSPTQQLHEKMLIAGKRIIALEQLTQQQQEKIQELEDRINELEVTS